jgi:hypothetical protein
MPSSGRPGRSTHEATAPSSVEAAIGDHVAALVEDGATLQMGIGAIPDAVLARLHSRQNLGIHTEMFSDGVVDLVKAGAVINRLKHVHRGRIVTSFVNGSQRVYDYVHDNPFVEFHPCDRTNDTAIIRANDKVTAINSALDVDLSGQVVADSIGFRIYSGIGGQMDFIHGAALSTGGQANHRPAIDGGRRHREPHRSGGQAGCGSRHHPRPRALGRNRVWRRQPIWVDPPTTRRGADPHCPSRRARRPRARVPRHQARRSGEWDSSRRREKFLIPTRARTAGLREAAKLRRARSDLGASSMAVLLHKSCVSRPTPRRHEIEEDATMANTATITLHPVWGCRWSKQTADDRWACVVDGHQRLIEEHECATCLFWEQAAEHSTRATTVPPVAQFAVRAVLVLAAFLFVATGLSILTGPLMVPFTIALWLGAAGLAGLAVFARWSAY